ncbi:hypothetical protein H6F76_11640 [Leptolyngbya sp. FACHB-321]|uniref:hypothetical protein n=1 Tax=Leptolyngbya sp. FACHB-321 TaxID=2692807 RepID=UPI001689B6F9|nr:hypothetical protein [Leptolyngbya sp. FACHB-321]MBD2035673.1 hypothetical protein [Leptolyngbya sp. FACHB-321]
MQYYLDKNRHYLIRKVGEAVFVDDAVCGLGSSDRPMPLFTAYARLPLQRCSIEA